MKKRRTNSDRIKPGDVVVWTRNGHTLWVAVVLNETLECRDWDLGGQAVVVRKNEVVKGADR